MISRPCWSLLLLLPGLVPACARPAGASDQIAVTRINYQGWAGSVLLGNGLVEAVIVPAIGRVMQFRLVGSADGPFWENAALAGARRDPASTEWANFGGDKAWPSPQSDWPRRIGRGWPPPSGFDSQPMDALIDPAGVTLVSPVDPDYGMRVRRRIELAPGRPVMTIVTRYEKVRGPALKVAVWSITQVKEPTAVFALPSGDSRPGPAFVQQSGELPTGLTVADGLVSLTRDPARNHKIGVRSGTLVWVGADAVLRLDAAVVAGAEYPDGGSSAEIYTQGGPQPYIELEILSPLAAPKPGEAIEHATTYTLIRRAAPTPAAEIKRILTP